jgi:hypothetical protein
MKVNEYKIIVECVERGVTFGMARAVKYTDTPTDREREQALVTAIMNEICEVFIFPETISEDF